MEQYAEFHSVVAQILPVLLLAQAVFHREIIAGRVEPQSEGFRQNLAIMMFGVFFLELLALLVLAGVLPTSLIERLILLSGTFVAVWFGVAIAITHRAKQAESPDRLDSITRRPRRVAARGRTGYGSPARLGIRARRARVGR